MYIDIKNDDDLEKLKQAADIIKKGGIVIFPTETVYGIGVNALNDEAVRKLYEIKKRPKTKPISLLVSDMKMIESVTKDISKTEYKIMEKFFPGPLTIILKKKECVSNLVTANKDTVGIRMPKGEIARKLVEYAGVPIATPSANITGNPSAIDIKNLEEDLKENVDCIINGKCTATGTASTIVQVINNEVHILRQGTILSNEIEKIII